MTYCDCYFFFIMLCSCFSMEPLPLTHCSRVGPIYKVQSFRSTLLQCGLPEASQVQPGVRLCHELPFPQATALARILLQHGLSMNCSFLQSISIGSCMPCRADICSTMSLCRLQEDNQLQQRISAGESAPAPEASPYSPSCTADSHIFSFLSSCCSSTVFFFSCLIC